MSTRTTPTGSLCSRDGLPPDLIGVLRDQSIVVPQDAAVFDLIGRWAKAPSNTGSSDIEECACGSGLPAKFWMGDGWVCGECYDEREADRA